jgi:hypothetical protein
MLQGDRIFSGPSDESNVREDSRIGHLPILSDPSKCAFYYPPHTDYLIGPLDLEDRISRFTVLDFPITIFAIPKAESEKPMFFVERGTPNLFFGILSRAHWKDRLAEYECITVDDIPLSDSIIYQRGTVFVGVHKTQARIVIQVDKRMVSINPDSLYNEVTEKLASEHRWASSLPLVCLRTGNRFLRQAHYPDAWSMRDLPIHLEKLDVDPARVFVTRNLQNVVVVRRPPDNVRVWLNDEWTPADVIRALHLGRKETDRAIVAALEGNRVIRVMKRNERISTFDFGRYSLEIYDAEGPVVTGSLEFHESCRNGFPAVQLDVRKGSQGEVITLGFVAINEDMVAKQFSEVIKKMNRRHWQIGRHQVLLIAGKVRRPLDLGSRMREQIQSILNSPGAEKERPIIRVEFE